LLSPRQILTAATPYSSLYPPLAALGSVPNCATSRLFNYLFFAVVRCASCCGAQNLLLALATPNFDRSHSLFLALSATGGARKRPQLRYIPII